VAKAMMMDLPLAIREALGDRFWNSRRMYIYLQFVVYSMFIARLRWVEV
jgi:hypothetical protein